MKSATRIEGVAVSVRPDNYATDSTDRHRSEQDRNELAIRFLICVYVYKSVADVFLLISSSGFRLAEADSQLLGLTLADFQPVLSLAFQRKRTPGGGAEFRIKASSDRSCKP